MSVESIYKNPFGRFAVGLLQKTGAFRFANRFLKSGISKRMIPGYIAKHQVDMQDFQGQDYGSFAEFFARKRYGSSFSSNPEVLISPCDGLLSIYPITEDLIIPMKGSHYRMVDLIPDEAVAEQLAGGICLVFRLQASDYHHFCAFDDAVVTKANFIPGKLHSVQPIACETLPVYRLNRRWWSQLYTAHFGNAVQIEVGAMLVGGVHFMKESGWFYRGDEMGNFELSGSTVLLMLSSEVREQLNMQPGFSDAFGGKTEIPVSMGEGIGVLTDAQNSGINKETDTAVAWRSHF